MKPLGKVGIPFKAAIPPVGKAVNTGAGAESEFNAQFGSLTLVPALTPRQSGGSLSSLMVPHSVDEGDEPQGPIAAKVAALPTSPSASRHTHAAIRLAVSRAAGDIHAVLMRLKGQAPPPLGRGRG